MVLGQRTQKATVERPHRAVLFVLSLAIVLSSGCGASSRVRIPFLSRSPQEAAGHRVERALSDARTQVASQSAYTTAVRYNPATCDCPSWEAKLFGRWQRVELRPAPTREEQQLTHARVQLTGDYTEGSTGWRYPALRWAPAFVDAP